MFKKLTLGLLLCILSVVYVNTFHKIDVGYFNDDARYIEAAISLSDGHYNDLEFPGHPPNIDRLPGYPIFLLPFVRVVEPHWSWLKLSSVALTLLSCIMMFLLFRNDLTWRQTLALVGLFAINPTIVKYSCSTMSEPFFLFLTLLVFLLFRRWYEGRMERFFWFMTIALSWAVITRPEGLALLFALPAGLVLSGKRRDAIRVIMLPSFVLGILLVRNYVLGRSPSGYVHQFAQILTYVSGNHRLFLTNAWQNLKVFLIDTLFQASFPILNVKCRLVLEGFICLLAMLIMAKGFIQQVRNREGRKTALISMGIFALAYLMLHSGFLSVNSRYYFTLIPFGLAWLMEGVYAFPHRLYKWPLLAWATAAGFLFLYANPWSSLSDKVFTEKDSYRIPQQSFTWIKQSTDPNAFILAVKASSVYLYTGRYSISEVPAATWKEFCTYLLSWRVTYILVAPRRLMVLSGRNFLNMLELWNTTTTWIPQRSNVFVKVYENPQEGTSLYRIVPAQLEKLVRRADGPGQGDNGYLFSSPTPHG